LSAVVLTVVGVAADAPVRTDGVETVRAGRTAVTLAPPGALVRIHATPPRPRTAGGGGGGVVGPEAGPTAAEVSAGDVDAVGAGRVARRHSFRTLVHVCSTMVENADFTFFSDFKNVTFYGFFEMTCQKVVKSR